MLKESFPFRVRLLFLPILTALFAFDGASAALNLGPPQPITEQVVVRPIVVRKNQTTLANFMGSEASETYIKEQVNRIWAQLGVEVVWREEVEYQNSFAYDGSPGNYSTRARPTSHLSSIINSTSNPPLSESPVELNMFFVGIAAGFSQLNANTAAGLATVDGNGSTLYVGGNLLDWDGGRDVIASVIAHEIGHNLGLSHYQADISNLMYSGSGGGEKLIGAQDSIISTDNRGYDGYDFLQALPSDLNYLAWAESFDLQQGITGDDDDDHLSNAFEFLYGSSPVTFTPHPSPSPTPQGLVWNLNKEPDAVEDGFSYIAESSSNLLNWNLADAPGSTSSVTSNGATNFRVLLQGSLGSNFIRFDVVTPPEEAAELASLPLLLLSSDSDDHEHSNCGLGGCGHQTAYPSD